MVDVLLVHLCGNNTLQCFPVGQLLIYLKWNWRRKNLNKYY